MIQRMDISVVSSNAGSAFKDLKSILYNLSDDSMNDNSFMKYTWEVRDIFEDEGNAQNNAKNLMGMENHFYWEK